MSRAFRLIANPLSGLGAAAQAVGLVADALRRAGAAVEVVESRSATPMGELVDRSVASGEVVVAVGGDGMIASVAGLVSERGGVLGIVPAGSGNDFARMLRLPGDPEEVAGVLLDGVERHVDLITYDVPGYARRVVAGSVYAGFDARTSLVANRLDWAPAHRKYEFAAIHNLVGYEPDDFEVTVDGVTSCHRGANVVVANSGYYGGGVLVAPNADVADGLLDVVVAEACGRREWLETLLALPTGGHVERDDVLVRSARSVTLRGLAADGGPVPVGGDGEPLPPLPALDGEPARVDVLPAALTVLVSEVST